MNAYKPHTLSTMFLEHRDDLFLTFFSSTFVVWPRLNRTLLVKAITIPPLVRVKLYIRNKSEQFALFLWISFSGRYRMRFPSNSRRDFFFVCFSRVFIFVFSGFFHSEYACNKYIQNDDGYDNNAHWNEEVKRSFSFILCVYFTLEIFE